MNDIWVWRVQFAQPVIDLKTRTQVVDANGLPQFTIHTRVGIAPDHNSAASKATEKCTDVEIIEIVRLLRIEFVETATRTNA